jgi:hypothetical protein
MLQPSAPFALAARCALIDYEPLFTANKGIKQQILNRVLNEIAVIKIDWTKP